MYLPVQAYVTCLPLTAQEVGKKAPEMFAFYVRNLASLQKEKKFPYTK